MEAFDWFKKAADAAYAPASIALGEMYEHGIGVGKDVLEAAAA